MCGGTWWLELLTRGAWRTCHMRMRGSFPYFLVSHFLVSVSHFSVPTFSVTPGTSHAAAQLAPPYSTAHVLLHK